MKKERGLFGTIARWALVVAAAILFVIEDIIWDSIQVLMSYIGKFKIVARIEERVLTWQPYAILSLFLLPMVFLFPLKLYALYLLSAGKIIKGSLVVIGAKITGTAFAARLLKIARPKLETIGWFAAAYYWLKTKKEYLYAEMEKIESWRKTKEKIHEYKLAVRELFISLRGEGHIFRKIKLCCSLAFRSKKNSETV